MQQFGSVPNIERAASFAGSLLVGRIMQGSWGRWALALSLGARFVGTLFASIPAVAPAVFGSLCVGLGLCTTPAITSALMRDRSSVATAATAFVTITTVMSLGQITGPAIPGALADRSGAHAVLMLIAAVYGAGAVLGTIDSVLQRTRSNDDRTGHLNASSFVAAVVTAQQAAIRYAERRRERRQEPLVDGLAGLESSNRARQDPGFLGQLVDAVSACDAKPADPRR